MKKKLLCLILALFAMTIDIDVFADATGSGNELPDSWQQYVSISGGLGGRTLTDSEMCQYGGYSGLTLGGITMNAVRMTIVDRTTGARISNSVDFYSGGLPSGFNRNTYVATGNKTRNEIISSATGYTVSGTRPYINYWANLPAFVKNGGGTTLKNYFVTKFNTNDVADMMTIFSMMNYNGYKDALIYENHALLVEPIFQFHVMVPAGDDGCESITVVKQNDYTRFADWFRESYLKTCSPDCANWRFVLDRAKMAPGGWGSRLETDDFTYCNCQLSYRYYYGTATEIFSMMKQTNDRILTYKINEGGSGRTIISNIGSLVHDDMDVGGLFNATGVAGPAEAYKHILDNYGLGTMHVWMKDIMEGCPNGQCPVTCPDGTILADGEDPAIACPPTYCPDMKTVIPYGKTAAEVCPGYTTTCNYNLKTKITNDCTDGQEGYIMDIGENGNGTTNLDEWKCIFDTANASRNTYEGEFYHMN